MIKKVLLWIVALIVLALYEWGMYFATRYAVEGWFQVKVDDSVLFAAGITILRAVEIAWFLNLALTRHDQTVSGVVLIAWFITAIIDSCLVTGLVMGWFNVPEHSPGPGLIWIVLMILKAVPTLAGRLPKA